MTSIRERIVAAIVERLKVHLQGYDVRRTRLRAVTRESKPSVSVNARSEESVPGDLHESADTVLTVEIALAAALDCESELDPVMVDVHRVVMQDESDDLDALAEGTDYTGCTWEMAESGDGLAVIATMTFTVPYRHSLTDMTAA